MRSTGRNLAVGAAAILCLILAGFSWFWLTYGAYGVNVMLRRGGTYWNAVKPDDPHLSRSMQLALVRPPFQATAGPLVWREVEKGFGVAELPVIANGQEVDRIFLNRIDPARFRFIARNAPNGDLGLDEWKRRLPAAVLIVNGSYFGLKGRPDTPFISEGKSLGPDHYDAKAGAFVATSDNAAIKDLSHLTWQAALQGSRNAMVSYPLLIGEDGKSHVTAKSRWLANRTFVGQESGGRIVIGTTREAFFSLDRLADFLVRSPLGLRVALNLDGGPIACQSVRLRGFSRRFYATWEAQVSGDSVRLLSWPRAKATWAMPVVLTVERK